MVKIGSKPIDELIASAKEGDGFAFTELWDRHIEQLRSYIKSFIPSNLDVDDVCCRSFEKAFRQIHSYDSKLSQFYTWLKTIARNTALDLIQYEQRFHAKNKYLSLDDYSHVTITDGQEDPLSSIIKNESEQETLAYVQGLPDLYREVAYKRMIEHLSYREIAEECDLTINTVKTRIRRAKEHIENMRKVEV